MCIRRSRHTTPTAGEARSSTWPIGRGHLYCYCDAPADGTSRLRGDDATGKLAELLTGFAAPVPAILDALGPDGAVHVSPIEEVTLDSWSYGSVLLLGDAAHPTSPNMAEGAAMALEDGLVLAECPASGDDMTQAVARFQARRRPRTQWVLAQTHRRDRTATCHPPSVPSCCAAGDGRSSAPTIAGSRCSDRATVRCRGKTRPLRASRIPLAVVERRAGCSRSGDAGTFRGLLPAQAAEAFQWVRQGADDAARPAPVVASYVRVAGGLRRAATPSATRRLSPHRQRRPSQAFRGPGRASWERRRGRIDTNGRARGAGAVPLHARPSDHTGARSTRCRLAAGCHDCSGAVRRSDRRPRQS